MSGGQSGSGLSRPKPRHVYKTGAAGCGGKAAPTNAKNSGQPLPCPFCDRIFKQDGRFKEHLKSQHGNQEPEQVPSVETSSVAAGSDGSAAAQNQSSSYHVKTPKTLLHEWCQKNRKPTAKYKHIEVEGGFHCRIILPDEKKSEADVIMWYKDAPESTSQDAQQRAAVVGLHQVMGDRRLDRILPEQYREQWQSLDAAAEKKKAHLKANPPKSKQRTKPPPEELHSVFMSEGNRRLVEDLIRDASSSIAIADKTNDSSAILEKWDEDTNTRLIADEPDHSFCGWKKNDEKGAWDRTSSGQQSPHRLNSRGREETQQAYDVRAAGASSNSHSEPSTDPLHIQLLNLGFGEKYVNLARSKCSGLSSALDWLVLNVPESELPTRFAPDASKSSVQVLVRGKQDTVESYTAIEVSVLFLQRYGYNADDCHRALVDAHGNAMLALSLLFRSLVNAGTLLANEGASFKSSDELSEVRSEERLALLSIFGEEAVQSSESSLSFQLGGASTLELEVMFPPGCCYPYEIPVIGFRDANLSPEVLLNITRMVANHALQVIGAPMIYDIVTFAQEIAEMSTVGDKGPFDYVDGVADMADKISADVKSSSSNAAHPMYEIPNLGRLGDNVSLTKVPVSYQLHPKTYQSPNLPRRQPPFIFALESTRLKDHWEQLMYSPKHADMRRIRSKLPAFKQRSHVLTSIEKYQVIVICGATGCGKSTQVPQYVFEDYIERSQGSVCNIICTQPRRLSAIGLADRVAKERGEATGETVGYSVRLERCHSNQTRLLFCTTGILLRRLLSDPMLEGVTHIIVDEVHERSLETDLLLLLLREILKRSDCTLRIILMSATVEASLYIDYFQDTTSYLPAVVQIPGFTHPVHELFLEDAFELTGYRVGRSSRFALKKEKTSVDTSVTERHAQGYSCDLDCWESKLADQHEQPRASLQRYSEATEQSLKIVDEEIINFELIEALLVYIIQQAGIITGSFTAPAYNSAEQVADGADIKPGAVLVFLPGIFEIRRLQSRLQSSSKVAACRFKLKVLALHGSLSPDEQRRVFQRPPHNVWKVVLATNIAETSITIDDVVYVIDTGRHKEMRYDHNRGLSSLEDSWISKANAKQRCGRAGRVQAGCCIRLFSRQQFHQFDDHQLPEVLRVSLEGLCLKVKSLLSGSIEERVRNMITPPPPQSVDVALRSLQELNALDTMGMLTPLGQHLAKMPADARVGKMLLFGCIFRCLDPVLTIAACLSGRSPFLSPVDHREEASAARQKLAATGKSDHMAVVAAFNGWLNAREEGSGAEMDYCKLNYLSRETLLGIEASRIDYEKILLDMGFITSRNSQKFVERTAVEDVDRESSCNMNAKITRVVKAVICAGFYPNVVRVQHPERKYVQTEGGSVVKVAAAQELRYYTKQDGRVFVHPSSVVFPVGHYESPWLVYSEKVKTSKVFVKECSMVPAYGLLLFGGGISVKHKEQTVAVDDWLEFEAPARIGLLIRELRSKVDSLLLQKLHNPRLDVASSPEVTVVVQLLTTDGF